MRSPQKDPSKLLRASNDGKVEWKLPVAYCITRCIAAVLGIKYFIHIPQLIKLSYIQITINRFIFYVYGNRDKKAKYIGAFRNV